MGGGDLAEGHKQRAAKVGYSGPSFAQMRPLFQDDNLMRGHCARGLIKSGIWLSHVIGNGDRKKRHEQSKIEIHHNLIGALTIAPAPMEQP
jgi:hypothetical protein